MEVEEKIRLLEEIKRLERSLHLMKSKLAAGQTETAGQWLPGSPCAESPWEAQKKKFRDPISRIGQYSTGGNSVEDIQREKKR